MTEKIIIITAPSGAGKSSIAHRLLSRHADKLAFSISAATRSPRRDEQDGVDYYFLSIHDFREKIEQEQFIEWEMVYEGKYYGTLKSELSRIWAMGKVPVLDIDVKGAIHVQKQFEGSALSIFIEPPSLDALETRLRGRNTETPESLSTRLSKAQYEISFKGHFDKIVVNNQLESACIQTEKHILDFIQLPNQSKAY